jgi:DNA-directed RNA polymerase specialized sigma24 family protein
MKASVPTDPTDAALVESAGERPKAFAELFERHRDMLVALCRRALGGSQVIEDVVQDTALAVLLGMGTLRDPERFGPWLSGIGLNICRRWQRERWDRCWSWEAVAGGVAPHRLVDPRLDPAEMAAEREFTRQILGVVEQLCWALGWSSSSRRPTDSLGWPRHCDIGNGVYDCHDVRFDYPGSWSVVGDVRAMTTGNPEFADIVGLDVVNNWSSRRTG